MINIICAGDLRYRFACISTQILSHTFGSKCMHMRLHRLGNAMNCDVFTYVLVENRTYVTIIKQRIIETLFFGRYIIEVDSWYVVGYAIDAMCVLFIKYTYCGQIVHIHINMCVQCAFICTKYPLTHYVAKTMV